ncbi:MAG: restriction endonuclease subunit S [Lachnospiraceae bacterium]|nr:restriction endonuclease subunit S [Lachnospiraceae bacterium]
MFPKKKLSDIAEIYNGNSINKAVKQQNYMKDVPGWNYIGTKDVDFDGTVTYKTGVIIPFAETKFRTAPAGTIFVCSEGGSAGKKTAIIKEEVCFGNKLYAIVNSMRLFIPQYVYYYTRYEEFLKQFKLKASTLMGGITAKNFGMIELPLPDLCEQKRIVSRIEELFSSLDNAVDTLRKTKEQLTVYRQTVLKEAFEGQLTSHLKIKVTLPWADEGKDSSLPILPNEWRYVPLKELGDLGRGKSKHRPRNDPKLFIDGKYPFIQTGEVKSARKYITDYLKQYGDFGLQQSKLWPKGTLCITIAANIAETAFLGIDACFPDSVVGFTPSKNILAEYIRYFIESQKIRLWAFAPATAQKNINLDTLENLIVPYCDIKEQAAVISEIESRMSVCDSIEHTVNTALVQAEAMRQSILKEAFEGRLA